MRIWTWLLALGLGPFSACLGGAPASSDAPGFSRPAEMPAMDVDLTSRDCQAALMVIVMTYNEAELWLPPGYHPRDIRDFFPELAGLPETGRTGAFLVVLSCAASVFDPEGYTIAFFGIYVEAPQVEGLAPSTYNVYEIARFTSHVGLSGLLDSVGWDWMPTDLSLSISSQLSMQATTWSAVATATDDESGGPFSFAVEANPPYTYNQSARFWNELPQGVGYFEYGFDFELHEGPVTSCAFRPGTPMEDILQSDDCQGQDVIGSIVPDVDFTAGFHYIPDSASR